jgi:hypothetical protein
MIEIVRKQSESRKWKYGFGNILLIEKFSSVNTFMVICSLDKK